MSGDSLAANEVSRCPLNMSVAPSGFFPGRKPRTLYRPCSTSCMVTFIPTARSLDAYNSPTSPSFPVGLSMFTRSRASFTSLVRSILGATRLDGNRYSHVEPVLTPRLKDTTQEFASHSFGLGCPLPLVMNLRKLP